MRSTRVMPWVFLVLSAAFFCLRDFRSALRLSVMEMEVGKPGFDPEIWVKRTERLKAWGVSQQDLRALASRAEQGRDAAGLAFAAAHLDDLKEAFHAADAAVAIDPGLTWVGFRVVLKYNQAPARELDPAVDAWLRKLEAFAPDDAYPCLLAGDVIRLRTKGFPAPKAGKNGPDMSAFASQTEWLAAMQKAYSQPHLTSLDTRFFLLDRSVMQAHGWDTAPEYLGTVATEPLPDRFALRTYANYKVFYLAAKAEREHRDADALREYEETSAFGRRLAADGSFFDGLVGVSISDIGAKALADKLEKTGRKPEADALRHAMEMERAELGLANSRSFRASSADVWAWMLFPVLTSLIAIFGGLLVVALAFLALAGWLRPVHDGFLRRTAAVVGNYFPILLFSCCLGLFLVNSPYANTFHHYMKVEDPSRVAYWVAGDISPLQYAFSFDEGIPMYSEFGNYVYAAAAGLVLVFVIAAIVKRRRGGE